MTTEPSVQSQIEGLLPAGSRVEVVAVVWATVDLDRAVAEIGLPAEALPDDKLLGAAVLLVRPPGADSIALLEPTTEGRLAATLAKSGEGPAGHYVLATDGLSRIIARATAMGIGMKRANEGPFGPSALVLGGPAAGPHLIIVDRSAGTIDR
jgi:hypothetical protein